MHRTPPRRDHKPALTVAGILCEADAFHARHGYWPQTNHSLEWRRIDNALRYGFFGVPGGSSLARLLAKRRGVRNVHDLPRLTVQAVLSWADRHQERTGLWPTETSGPVREAPGETWMGISLALARGYRGLRGGSSLAKLLQRRRG